MKTTYLAIQLHNLIHITVAHYTPELRLWEIFGVDDSPVQRLTETRHGIVRELFLFKDKDYPVIGDLGDGLIYVTVRDLGEPSGFFILGPVVSSDQKERFRVSKKLQSLDIEPTEAGINDLLTAANLLYAQVYLKYLSISELWELNAADDPSVKNIPVMMTEQIFRLQENQAKHNPYDQELRELESIEAGDVEGFNRSISETYQGTIGTLADNPLRHHKNVAIGNITLASRAAIRGGLSPEISFSMADRFIQEVERLETVPEVEMFKRESQRTYARTVAEEGVAGHENENVLVEQVKDYIFSHLHDNVKVSDMAKALKVNPDYLSHLFSLEEGMTIKRYMLEEKIKRAKNLLKYSDYSLQEIAFYLGFSSQSYFSQIFAEIVGDTPAKYRKKKRPI